MICIPRWCWGYGVTSVTIICYLTSKNYQRARIFDFDRFKLTGRALQPAKCR